MKRRKSEKDQELTDRNHLFRAWRRRHRESLEKVLAGVHGAVLARLMAQLKNLSEARELVAAVAAEDWSVIDADTRFIALHEINRAICKLREARNLTPIDDPLPGQPENAFRIVKAMFNSFPPQRGSTTEVSSVNRGA
jgi:broad specificity phosphatase PhoE